MTETTGDHIDQEYQLIAEELVRFAEAIDVALAKADLGRHASSAVTAASRLASRDDLRAAARARRDNSGWPVS